MKYKKVCTRCKRDAYIRTDKSPIVRNDSELVFFRDYTCECVCGNVDIVTVVWWGDKEPSRLEVPRFKIKGDKKYLP